MNTEREKGAESAQMELTVLRRYPHQYIVELVHHFRAATGHELLFLERMQGGSLIDLLAQYEPDEENVGVESWNSSILISGSSSPLGPHYVSTIWFSCGVSPREWHSSL